jgi:hypothetical protein
MKILPNLLKSVALLALLCSGLSAAPAYYLFDGDNNTAFQVDPETPALVNTFTIFQLGYAVAIVGDDIRVGERDDGTGFEYTLGGVPTGVSFTGGANFSQLIDGTGDGTYNYGVECCAGTNSVMRADLFWRGGTPLFTLPDHGTGITYDSAAGTLWVGLFDGTVRQYTLAGIELSSFSLSVVPAALAYEAASDTLWLHPRTGPTLEQYSKTGTLLQTVTIPGWSPENIYGGEIVNVEQAVPEPGTFGLLGFALAAVAVRRFKK